ncbi:MAG: phospholipase [Chloroflexota bacterium]|nr:MAG: phospholipase [Chloroflexota bacterium]
MNKYNSVRMLLSELLVIVVLSACTLVNQETGTPDTSDHIGWYQVYFTESESPKASTLRDGPDAALVEAIDQARLSVEMAMDSLDLWSLREALLAAHRRGVDVRVVVETDNLNSEEVQELIANGIPSQNDRQAGLMHNKFAVIDRLEVWTGSMNFTVNGAYRSDNNLIRIRSPDLAEDYLVEFEEMFTDRQFGPNSPANTPYRQVKVSGTLVEVYFSPDDDTIERVIELVMDAQHSVKFMAYSFTDDELAAALIENVGSGLHVSGVLEKSQALSNTGGEYETLLENGVNVRLDGNPASMHHKVLIIDEQVVVTGSYNFSQSAKTRNDENTLIIHSAEIAALYLEEFERVWLVAMDPSQ